MNSKLKAQLMKKQYRQLKIAFWTFRALVENLKEQDIQYLEAAMNESITCEFHEDIIFVDLETTGPLSYKYDRNFKIESTNTNS